MSSFLAQLLDTLGLAPPAGPGAAPGRVESDLLLALGFLTIPAVLGRAGRRRPAPPRTVLVWAGLWAVLCGVSHLADALSCLTPLGGTAAVVKVAAAAASWVALVGVLRSLPRGVSAAESAAREADLERLRVLEAAVTASGDGVMVSEAPHGSEPGPRIVYANPAFEQMTGYLASEAVGQSPSILHDSVPRDDPGRPAEHRAGPGRGAQPPQGRDAGVGRVARRPGPRRGRPVHPLGGGPA